MGKRELVALLSLSSWCLVMVERLFLMVPWGCLRFVIVVFPDHTNLLFFMSVVLNNVAPVDVSTRKRRRIFHSLLPRGCLQFVIVVLYPTTKVWRGIMLYPSVSVRPSVLTISDR